MKSQVGSEATNRPARSDATRQALMRAAEKMIAADGIENVTIRDILTEAGQKNTSALQYHFKNLKGLINAIHATRSGEVQQKRAQLLAELLTKSPQPSLRQICALMVQPVFDLARSNVDVRRYVKAFGHELALSETSALSKVTGEGGGAGGSSGAEVGKLLRDALPHLGEGAYRRRMESAVRLCSASMYHHARQAKAFRGDAADLFFNSLVDALVGLLNANESDETRAIASSVEANSP